MKLVTTTAIAAALALGVAAPPATAKKTEAPADPNKPQWSPAFRQAVQPIQTALSTNDAAAAQAALPAAQAAATTPDDKFQLGAIMVKIGSLTQNNDILAQGADMAIASGKASPTAMAQLLNVKGVVAYNKGDLAAADAAFSQAYQQNPGDANNAILLAQTKVREKQPQAALPIVDQAIKAQTANGQRAPQAWYIRALAIASDAKMPAETAKYGQMLVTAYPSTGNWRSALQLYRQTNQLDAQINLDTLRLLRASGALAGERDYFEYANLANDKGYPGEAKAVIDEGMASNMVDNGALKNSRALNEIKNLAAGKIAADKGTLPAQEKAARAAADGRKALNTGDAYLGYKMFPQAAEMFKLAIQKGGIDANIAKLRLGEALAQSGQKDAADQAFDGVTGAAQPLAQFWKIWNDEGAKPAPAQAAADPAPAQPAAPAAAQPPATPQ